MNKLFSINKDITNELSLIDKRHLNNSVVASINACSLSRVKENKILSSKVIDSNTIEIKTEEETIQYTILKVTQ